MSAAESKLTNEKMTNEEILAVIKECAEKLGRAPLTAELMEASGGVLNRSLVARRFGSHTRALKACGLVRPDKGKPRDMMELFLAWANTARRLKHLPSSDELMAETKISLHCYVRKFGRYSLVRTGMAKFMEKEGLEAEWEDVMDLVRQGAPPRVRRRLLPPDAPEQTAGQPAAQAAAQGTDYQLGEDPPPQYDRPLYGAPIHHPCMLSAPTNEYGVLGLFVAMARELGFIVTRIQKAFPDVEALRRMTGGRWRRTLIELEFESASFRTHEHDPKGCDLIVCWVHNWKDCPVEVIELGRLFKIG